MKMKKILALAMACMAFGSVFAGCQEKEEDLTVYMPDGAPALAFAEVMSADTEEDGVEYRVVAPTTIATKINNKDMAKNADLCALPVTAASKLVGTGEKYKMVAVLTQGNLYMISKSGEVGDLSELVGKTVGVLQINEVPGLTFKAILNKNQIAWQELADGVEVSETAVNLKAIADANGVNAGDTSIDHYVLAEPAVSVQVAKKGFSIVGDLQAWYGADENGEIGYPQAVLVAKTELLEEKSDWVSGFVSKLQSGAEYLKTVSGTELVECVTAHLEDASYTTTLKADILRTDVLGRCGVKFAYAKDFVSKTNGFLREMIAVNPVAAKEVSADFYWSIK